MTDVPTAGAPPALPPLAATMLASIIRAALQGLAGVLVTKGLLEDGQSAQFVTVALGLALSGAGLAWSWLQHRNAHIALKAAVAAVGPPVDTAA